MQEKKKEAVEKLLKKSDGLSVSDISRILKISRNTVAVALAEFSAKNWIIIKNFGMAKVHYWRKK